jgi:hypothetical protein
LGLRARRHGGGFWKGIVTGLLLAFLAGLLLAWLFPLRFFAPLVPEDAGIAPEAPPAPAAAPGGPIITEDAAGPLVPDVGPPSAPGAPAPVRDRAGNSPSLVPLPPAD